MKKLDFLQVETLWHTFLRIAGVKNLDEVPKLSDPEHPHVKTVLFMYSLECFLFNRLNKSCRDQDKTAIKTLGPYSVCLTRIIERVQHRRKDRITGEFTCFRGIKLDQDELDVWMKKKVI